MGFSSPCCTGRMPVPPYAGWAEPTLLMSFEFGELAFAQRLPPFDAN